MYLGCRRAQRLSTDEQTKSIIVHVVSRIVAQLKLDEFTANQSLKSQQINYLNGSRFVRFVCAMRRTAKAHGLSLSCLSTSTRLCAVVYKVARTWRGQFYVPTLQRRCAIYSGQNGVLTYQRSYVFKHCHSDKHFSAFYLQDGGKNQLA